ncbi:MAG: 50S ribosomal protein L9 [Bacteroidetes bacterium]|jgi:large subunit ribosomal protein L9|nr:50S ribosomal protein L9 [Bacteroidota bacterium]MBT5529986.1 50S ribosomal protein L9 [Cytophagia bacterium]MBT3423133.1 50S ribosomal protein L9 [Bacteroidota bacterium]MBT3800949.1 50S ribosomal protein L9 [Bacteroidota bacterium]MBT3933425.1 50S ribosomal protein L9 [Bacteroidota bacterium]
MEIILKQDIENLGYAGDIIKVKSGYARNFLIPKKMAILATESNKKVVAENQRQASHKIAKLIEDAQAVAAKLAKATVKIPVKVGTSGKLFGSITNLQISRSLKDMGYDIDRKDILILEDITEVGKYKIKVKLHKEVQVEMNLAVQPEKED